jgi:hypothetical protein
MQGVLLKGVFLPMSKLWEIYLHAPDVKYESQIENESFFANSLS